MRLTRTSWLAMAVLATGACTHDDVIELIGRDGSTSIPVIDLNTASAGGFLSGTRAVNRFIAAGAFDTSVADAFARATTTVPNFILDPNGFYGSTAGRQLYYGAGGPVANYFPPNRLLPAVVNIGQTSYGTLYGVANAVTYIVPGGHAGNGAGNTSWEFWYVIRDLVNSQRYIMGLARYALQQRGQLDWAELLLTGTVTQPDSLVFVAGDFTPAGNKADDNGFIVDCANPAEGRPVDGANPHFIAGKTVGATSASKRIIIDHTICSDASTVWSNGFTSTKSPVPVNNKAPGRNQYNFLVVWEALPDSTPDYSRPVWREQIAPVLTTAGTLLNNGYAPIPTAALTSLQLGPLPGSTSRPDSMKLTFNNIKPLAAGAYQVWLLRTDSAKSQLVTGRVVRLNGATVVDTLNNVSEFNTGGVITGARVEFDVGTYPAGFWNAATLAVAGTAGNTTLPASQPLWTTAVGKDPGVSASFGGSLGFGSFSNGAPVLFGAAGTGTGGVFGTELREDIKRLPRPPVGYMYEAWLTNTADSTKRVNLGPILAPYPDLTSLVDADVSQNPPLSGAEIIQAAIRTVAPAATFYCAYDRVQVRLSPKNGNTTVLSPTIVLSGTKATC